MKDKNTLKQSMRDSFIQLAQDIEGSFKDMKDELRNKIAAAQKETKEFVTQINDTDRFVKSFRDMKNNETHVTPPPKVDNPPKKAVKKNSNEDISKTNIQTKATSGSSKKKVTWFGTSLSKALDRKV